MASKTASPKTSAKTSAKIPVKTSKQSSAKTKTMISATVSAKVVSSPKKSSHKKVTSAKKSGAGTTSSTKTGITTKPLNPIQVDRMQRILDYIKSKKSAGVSKEELLDWCLHEELALGKSLGKSSVMEYLKLIKDVWKEPIETELVTGSHYQKVAWYFYRPGAQYVPSVQDIATVKNAFTIIRTLLDHQEAFQDDIEDDLANLEKFFSKNHTLEYDTIIFNDRVVPNSNSYIYRVGRVSDIYEFIKVKEILEIHYQDFDGNKFTFRLHPHCLYRYNRRWYVFGYNPEKEIYNWLYPLDRIVEITPCGQHGFRKSVIDNWDAYFISFIGVNAPNIVATKDDAKKRNAEEYKQVTDKQLTTPRYCTWDEFKSHRSTIKLRINNTAKNLLQSKPVFPDQEIIADPKQSTFYMLTSKCFLNVELEGTILRFGEQVEVVEPKELRDKLKQRSNLMTDIYNKGM